MTPPEHASSYRDRSTLEAAATITCPACGQYNLPNRRFCGQCGESLWRKCVYCRHENPVSERYCGQCGANLEEDLKAAREDLEDRFRRADAAESEGRYLDALSALRPIAPSDHEALQVYHQKAQQRIEQLNALRVAGEEAQIEALARAQELAEQRKYESALATIDSILPGLRSEEMQQLGRELQAILGEIRQLTREVRSALKQKQILTVAGQVDRLWELTPDDPSVTKLKEKLDEHLMTVAARDAQRKLKLTRERLQQGNYRAARELVQTIPEEFRTGDTKKVCQRVVELGWMWEQLRSSPAATPQLARIASRLQSARPDDARIRELAEKLNTRLRTPRPSRTWARNWARSADVGPLQREVRWWTGWDGPTADAVDCQLLERQPGRFLVAFGLAVQGLGRAALPLNLQPLDRRAPWLGLGRPLSRKLRTASPVWGVDLGRSGLKAVRLSVDRKTQQIRLEDLAFLPHDDLLTTNTPLESIRTINSETVARFLREKKLRGPKIVLGLPGYRSLGRFFVVPSADPGKVNDAISYELKAQIPIPAEDLALAQHVVADEGADVKSTRVMLVAARAEHLKLQRQPFETQRCEVLSVQSNFLALYNAASQSLWDQPDVQRPQTACAILEVGQQASNMVVGNRQRVWFRSLPFGTDKLVEAVMKQLCLTRQQAETVCREQTGWSWLSEVDEVLGACLHDLLGEVRRTIDIYEGEYGEHVEVLLGCGGGFAQQGLLRFLQLGQ